jgi:thymidine kinase
MLEVICGPMYCGKSEELMRRLRRLQIAGKKVVAVKPVIDSRYEIEYIQSHNGTQFECFPIHESGLDLLKLSRGFDVVGIDEAQFFDYKLQEIVKILFDRGKLVILAGLDMTYRQEPWKSMPFFMAIANKIDKYPAVCHSCGDDAFYTQRLIDGKPAPFDGPTVVVGGLDSYEARCGRCFERG